MNTVRATRSIFLLTTIVTLLLAGCGGGGEVTPPPEQTGDISLFANSQLLVSPTTFDPQSPNVIVLDARHSEEAYNQGHIPHAIHVSPNLFFDSNDQLLPEADLRAILGGMGISVSSKIVIYDDTSASLGAGGFLFWLLEYLGCTDVAVLNGGWYQWTLQRPSEVTTTAPDPLTPQVFGGTSNPALYITRDALLARLYDPTLLIVDARSNLEYLGQDPNDEAVRHGHIDGAINLPYTACYNNDQTVLNQVALKKLFDSHFITADREVVVYSTVGKRSAFMYFLSRLMDYNHMKNYPGSIVEWAKGDAATYPMETN